MRGEESGEGDKEERTDDVGEGDCLRRVGEWTGSSSSEDDESRTFSADLYPFILEDIFVLST